MASQQLVSTVVIKPTQSWFSFQLKEFWDRRELVYMLAWREVKVRYKQSVLGIAWVIIQPAFTIFVFSVIFGHLAKLPSGGLPYPLFSAAALLPWNLFSASLTRSSNSVVGSGNLIQKVYFPRLVIPAASVVSVLVDFGVQLLLLMGLMIYYGHVPTVAVLAAPLFVLLAAGTALGVGLWLSALNAQYRDINQAVPFLVQAWMYATPVAYGTALVPEKWRALYAINPITGIVEGFRWAVLDVGKFPGVMVAVSAGVAAALLVTGAVYFRRMERSFADVI